jgi:FtsZ-binding cell division protein ZapB
MSAIHASHLGLEMLRRMAQGIGSVGVVGNDGDLRFDAQDAQESLAALQAQLRTAGYHVGSLAIDTLARPHDDIDTLIYDTSRYENLAEAQHAWEGDYRRRRHDQIEAGADDWIERLRALRSQMEAWLQTPDLAHLSIVDQPPVSMSEEPMRRFGVKQRMMPAFEIRAGNQRIMRFQPKGLWIIGANGRVDLITKAAAPILADLSEPLSRPSNWQLYDSGNAGRLEPLTQESFRKLIRNGL